MFQRILIANRGEIAVRILRGAHDLGLHTIAVYSDADANAQHVRRADEAVRLGPAPAVDSYLNIERILDAARRTGAEAIHPGYGFLAENAAFAAACADAGLVWVGPPAAVIAALGDKAAARRLAAAAGVPVIPGYDDGDQSDAALTAAAQAIGYPLLVKAAAGGGGKGLRRVDQAAALPAALAAARREAAAAFGDDRLLLERALVRPRHVEFQILADQHGHVIHLGERDCSVQRRYQKVVEEAPAPGLTAVGRAAMGAAAVTVARAAGYVNAGTVEMLLDEGGDFYFLEMNTRIQVEHPVTELISGQDLIAWQLRLAAGERLTLTQDAVSLSGHAVEARLYAEDPARDFLPATGTVQLWRPPAGAGIRVDSALQTGDAVTVHYDPLLAKICAHGPDRDTARRRLRRALAGLRLAGLRHNRAWLLALLADDAFAAGGVATDFVPRRLADWAPPAPDALAYIAVALAEIGRWPRPAGQPLGWRNSPNRPLRFAFTDGVVVDLTVVGAAYQVEIGPEVFSVTVAEQAGHDWALAIDGRRRPVTVLPAGDDWWVSTAVGDYRLRLRPWLPAPDADAAGGGSLRAPMPGRVLQLLVAEGDAVTPGQPLLILEAMKMEHTIRAPAAGVVQRLFYGVDDQVEAEADLVRLTGG